MRACTKLKFRQKALLSLSFHHIRSEHTDSAIEMRKRVLSFPQLFARSHVLLFDTFSVALLLFLFSAAQIEHSVKATVFSFKMQFH